MATYKVVDNHNLEKYGIKLGDKCVSKPYMACIANACWFYNKDWEDDGIWCLEWKRVRQVED